jgi:cation transport ATPase
MESATAKGNASVPDKQLMREALEALEKLTAAAERQAEYANQGALIGLVGMMAEPRERARTAITKLEERLLRE